MRNIWWHVLVDHPRRGRLLIAIEAADADEARSLIAADFGDEHIREVTASHEAER